MREEPIRVKNPSEGGANQREEAGIGSLCDSSGPHFLFLTCGTSLVLAPLEADPAGLQGAALQVLLPSACCSLDLEQTQARNQEGENQE